MSCPQAGPDPVPRMKRRTRFARVPRMSIQAAYQSSATPQPKAAEDGRVTPMMAQYVEIKAANPDCLLFYRMGDFYELFFEDAEIASGRSGSCSPSEAISARTSRCAACLIERADDYLQRLIGLGHRVAVCEQTEDPAEAKKRGAKSVVRRDVVRLVTPGTITEERLLDPARANPSSPYPGAASPTPPGPTASPQSTSRRDGFR